MRYRKKPVEVDARQWDGTGENAVELVTWIGLRQGARYAWGEAVIRIVTLEGEMQADPGDWIIRGVAGEFYPCKPEIFEQTYEPVEST